ncbi:MAG TPA: riboflavin synthase [Gammaproteobacteria bacterium]
MFSGIVKGVGKVLEAHAAGSDRRLVIGTAGVPLGPLEPGASVAVNGVCLTATECAPDRFAADVSAATAAVTTLGALGAGAAVNLEPSLRVGDPLDGHLVLGHVDGVGRVAAVRRAGASLALEIELPPGLEPFVAVKGSIAVDGVSLTVNAVDGRRFAVNVIPHTAAVTVIGTYTHGTAVNIEVDLIARYLARLREFPESHGHANHRPD